MKFLAYWVCAALAYYYSAQIYGNPGWTFINVCLGVVTLGLLLTCWHQIGGSRIARGLTFLATVSIIIELLSIRHGLHLGLSRHLVRAVIGLTVIIDAMCVGWLIDEQPEGEWRGRTNFVLHTR